MELNPLEGWATVLKPVDAYYYLYILHFLRWLQGAQRDEYAMGASLEPVSTARSRKTWGFVPVVGEGAHLVSVGPRQRTRRVG